MVMRFDPFRDIDRLTRNLTDWNAFEKACVRHGVRLSAYTGGDLDLSTAEGAYYGGMETLRARRESAVKSARVREAQDREARKGRRTGGGQRWFGYTRIYANPDEPNHKKRHILREEINPVESEAIRDAAVRVLEHGESVASIAPSVVLCCGFRPAGCEPMPNPLHAPPLRAALIFA